MTTDLTGNNAKINKIVLAYSGGLDTSAIAKWLELEYQCEVLTFTADLGQGEEIEDARTRALAIGIKADNIFIEDLREEFVRDFVWPMMRANTIYEGEYLLGTSIARPLITKRLVEIAAERGADAIAHGATGKGNDQIRFELGAYAINPDIKVIAPWREWQFSSRQDLMDFCEQQGIDLGGLNAAPAASGDKQQSPEKAPYSMDANLLHISYEGCELEDPAVAPDHTMWQRTNSPQEAPDKPLELELEFNQGDLVAIDGKKLTPACLLEQLNLFGGEHGIGRVDMVENRFVGMKSRGCYETPGGTILLKAHRAIESLTLDRETAYLKDSIMPSYAQMIYNGNWWAPERVALQCMIDATQNRVEGKVKLQLYKGNVTILGRSSAKSLFNTDLATFEDSAGAYNQKDAAGFIRLNALRFLQNKK